MEGKSRDRSNGDRPFQIRELEKSEISGGKIKGQVECRSRREKSEIRDRSENGNSTVAKTDEPLQSNSKQHPCGQM